MFELLTLFIIIFIILFYNRIYFLINKEKVVFYKYFKGLILYSFFILGLITIILNFNIINRIDGNFLQSSIITYFIIFLVIFFNISTKSYDSPTVIIYNVIKKKGATYNKILRILKKKKLIEIRFKDLLKQNLIKKINNKITLTPLGYKFSRFYFLLKLFFKIKCKG